MWKMCKAIFVTTTFHTWCAGLLLQFKSRTALNVTSKAKRLLYTNTATALLCNILYVYKLSKVNGVL